MSFRYFAYGSNMWLPQMRSRCSSAVPVEVGRLPGWEPVYDKPSSDGSAKMNVRRAEPTETHGVLYEIEDGQRPDLDKAEPGYTPITVVVETESGRSVEALTYQWTDQPTASRPYEWYVEAIRKGASQLGLDGRYVKDHLSVEADEDPVAPGLRPATETDLPRMQEILSEALAESDGRYTIHPGDLAWWMWHDDPRYPDTVSYWLQPGVGFVVIDARSGEINVFATEAQNRLPLLDWAQRRLGGRGEVGCVADSDVGLIDHLAARSYRPSRTSDLYQWDLSSEPPAPSLADGWELRPLRGREEADARRRASHSAFRSTMDAQAHLDRYLRFMSSPVYERDRDLVAVSPHGEIGSFMVWWPDRSGIAQIEPFGTHSDFQRQGIATALIRYGLSRMRAAGMVTARVVTDDYREDANAFYKSAGFDLIDQVRSYSPER